MHSEFFTRTLKLIISKKNGIKTSPLHVAIFVAVMVVVVVTMTLALMTMAVVMV